MMGEEDRSDEYEPATIKIRINQKKINLISSLNLKKGRNPMAWEGYKKAASIDPDGVSDVLEVADTIKATESRRNMSPSLRHELAWIVEIESGWDPAAVNPFSGASGLIQFMPGKDGSAVMLGTTVEKLRTMTRKQQAPYVADYFRMVLNSTGPLRYPGDMYLAVFYPSATGRPDSDIIADVGTKVWIQNPGLREPGGGPITVGFVRRKGIPRSEPSEGIPEKQVPVDSGKTTSVNPIVAAVIIAILIRAVMVRQ